MTPSASGPRPAASQQRGVPPAEAEDSSLQAKPACIAAAEDIDDAVFKYVGGNERGFRRRLNAAFEKLNPAQVTAVLQECGQRCLVQLIESGPSRGGSDFAEICLELIRQRRFTGEPLELFGNVVPFFISGEARSVENLPTFVCLITSSTVLSTVQKDLIIWGTRDADPIRADDGHWAKAVQQNNHLVRAALLSGTADAAFLNPSAAALFVPRDLERHVQALEPLFPDPRQQQVFLGPAQDYLSSPERSITLPQQRSCTLI